MINKIKRTILLCSIFSLFSIFSLSTKTYADENENENENVNIDITVSSEGIVTVNNNGTVTQYTSGGSENKLIENAEKGISSAVEGAWTDALGSYYDAINNPNYATFQSQKDEYGYETGYSDNDIRRDVYGAATQIKGTDGKTYEAFMNANGQITICEVPTDNVSGEFNYVNYSVIENGIITEEQLKAGFEESLNGVAKESMQNNNYLQDGLFWTDGLITNCASSYVAGSRLDGCSEEEYKAYSMLMESGYANNLGIGIQAQLAKFYEELKQGNTTMTQQEANAKLAEILASAENGVLSDEAIQELMLLQEYIDTLLVEECEDGEFNNPEYGGKCTPDCGDNELLENSRGELSCSPDCDETTQQVSEDANGVYQCLPIEVPNSPSAASTNEGSGAIASNGEDANITPPPATPTPTLEVTEPPLIPEDMLNELCDEDSRFNMETLKCESILPTPESPTTPEDETENQEFIETMKKQLEDITIDTYEGQNPINVEIGGLKAQIYIKNKVDLMSSDNANFSKLQNNDDGTFSYVQNDDYGNSTVYSKAYDANGEVISDLVITSTQYGLVTFNGNNGLIKPNSIVKLYGSGTQDSYTVYGYGEVGFGNTNATFGTEGSYKADSTKNNRKDMISINIITIGGVTLQDSLRGVIHEAIYQMENYNYESFVINPVTMESLGDTSISIVLIDDKDSRVVEVAENGQKVTYKYQMHQLVTTSNGDMYSLIDVMKHNLFNLDVLINAGFEVTRNGELVTVDTIDDLTYDKLLGNESSSIARPTIDPENPDAPTVTPTPLPSDNRDLVAIGDTLTPDRIEEANKNNPEYVWSSDTHDYYIPEGVVDDIEFKFYNKETEEYETLTFSEALAKGYITPEDMKAALEKQGINVYAVEKLDTKPYFRVVTKELENNEEYVDNVTKFWEDNAYEYAFENAEMYDRTYILTSNGLKYTLDYVLKHNVYSIEELIENGLNCIKTTKAAGIVSSMTIVDSKVYRDIYVNEDTSNGGIYVGTKLFSSIEDVNSLPENLKKSLEEKFGSLDNYFADGKSFIIYGICSENGKTSFTTSLSLKDDTLYANIGYASENNEESNEENNEETKMINYVDVISFSNEDVLSKTNGIEKVSDMKVSVNIKDIVSPQEEDVSETEDKDNSDNGNDKVANVQTKYDTIIAHGKDIDGAKLYTSLEEVEKLPVEIKDEIVKRLGDLETFFKDGKSFVLYGIESSNTHKPQDFYKIEVNENKIVAVVVNVPAEIGMSYGQAFTYYVDIISFENSSVLANSTVDSVDKLEITTRISESVEIEEKDNGETNNNDKVDIVQTTYPNISRYGSSLDGATLYTSLEQAKNLPEDIQKSIVDKVGDLETFFKDGKSFVLYGLNSNTSQKSSTLSKIEVKDDKIIAVLEKIEDEPGTSYLQALTNYVDMVVFENASVLANSSVDDISKISLEIK